MAKEIKTIVVGGKYAQAVVRGCEISTLIKNLNEEMTENRRLILDKTVKIPETEQSVRLAVNGTDDTAILSMKRSVSVMVTDDLKEGINGGKYQGVLKVDRNIGLKNPDDLAKAIAVLNAAGIECEEKWAVSATAAGIDKFREKNGSDTILDSAIQLSETEVVTFEAK